MDTVHLVGYLATVSAGLWTGAAIYIGFAEHPSALRVGLIYATEYFRHMSKRTAPLMMVLSAAAGGAGLYVWFQTDSSGWLIGGSLQLAMFPLTGLLIVPTNLQLLKVDAAADATTAARLHGRWGKMHWLRTVIGGPAFLIFLWLLLAPPAAAASLQACNNTRVQLQFSADAPTGLSLPPGSQAELTLAALNGWIDFGQIGRRYALSAAQEALLQENRYRSAQFEADGKVYISASVECPATLTAQPAGFPLQPAETLDLT